MRHLFGRNGISWSKVAVPRSLREELGDDLRRSVRARDPDTALARRGAVLVEIPRESGLEERRRPTSAQVTARFGS